MYTVEYKLYHSNAGYLGKYTKDIDASRKSEARAKCKQILEKNVKNIGGVYSFRIGKAVSHDTRHCYL